MPPVMGAAAFLMAEYVGITYADVVRHAFLPAIITYGALFYIVDIEAAKKGMTGLPRYAPAHAGQGRSRHLITLCGLIILSGLIYWGLGWTKTCSAKPPALALAVVVRRLRGADCQPRPPPRLAARRSGNPLVIVPDFYEVARTGLHYLAAGLRADLVPDDRGDVAWPGGFLGRVRHGGRGADATAAHRVFPQEGGIGRHWRQGWQRISRQA